MIAFDVIVRALWSPKRRKGKQDGEEGNDEESSETSNNSVSGGYDRQGETGTATGNGEDKETESKR
jgi:hypothetical protein